MYYVLAIAMILVGLAMMESHPETNPYETIFWTAMRGGGFFLLGALMY